MKQLNSVYTQSILSALLFLGACAQGVEKTKEAPVTDNNVTSAITNTRLCTDQMTTATKARLFGFFGFPVINLEGPATFCLTVEYGDNANLTGDLRIEYEDDKGIRYYTVTAAESFFGTYNDGKMQLVWIDSGGLIEVKAEDNGSDVMVGTIKYHNFPSYEDQIAASAEEAAAKCQSGAWTYAECMGYRGPNTNWWQMPAYQSGKQQMITKAKEILNDATKTKVLSNIEFNLGDTY